MRGWRAALARGRSRRGDFTRHEHLLVRPLEPAVIVGVPAFGSVYLKLALLEPLAIETLEMVEVSVASRKAYVPLELLLRLTVMAPSDVVGLL